MNQQQFNQQQFAALTLKFLSRSNMVPNERDQFAAVESVLQQLGNGTLIIGTPQPEPKAAPTPPEEAPIMDESGVAVGSAGAST